MRLNINFEKTFLDKLTDQKLQNNVKTILNKNGVSSLRTIHKSQLLSLMQDMSETEQAAFKTAYVQYLKDYRALIDSNKQAIKHRIKEGNEQLLKSAALRIFTIVAISLSVVTGVLSLVVTQ